MSLRARPNPVSVRGPQGKRSGQGGDDEQMADDDQFAALAGRQRAGQDDEQHRTKDGERSDGAIKEIGVGGSENGHTYLLSGG